MMLEHLYNLSGMQLATLVCTGFVLFTWVGAIFVRPFFRLLVRSQPDLNSVLGNIVSMYGIFYGILIGLLAVSAYQNKATVEHSITAEGTAVLALFRSLTTYPEKARRPMQETLRDYTQFVIDNEWPLMRRGEFTEGASQLIDQLQRQIAGFEPQTVGQQILHAETTKQFYEFLKIRAERRYNATTGIPEIMWFVVLLGAFLTIFLVWLFNMSLIAELFLGGLLSFFIGIVVSLIMVLDRPLRGDFGITPEVFELLLKFMNKVISQATG
jgi:hypothetical protein